MTIKKFKQKTMLEAAHEMAHGLHKAGVIDKKTMREFDITCLPPVCSLSQKKKRGVIK